MLPCPHNLPIMLNKCPYYVQTMHTSLHHTHTFQQVGSFVLYSTSVWWCIYPNISASTLISTVWGHAQSLLSSNIGEEAMTYELLPAT